MKRGRIFVMLAGMVMATVSPWAFADQFQQFGEYIIHYNALSTDFLPADRAKHYGITRSRNRGMLTLAVRKQLPDGTETAVAAEVDASAVNLNNQYRDIALREFREDQAIYYVGDFPVSHQETLRFTVLVKPEDSDSTYSVKFSQRFVTR
ncbi:MAG: DUF4426 domain-containing protein [Pseudomonadota bacterium]|nr:DUF4426 domain-containing protein [Pseudomonadota bacterium]